MELLEVHAVDNALRQKLDASHECQFQKQVNAGDQGVKRVIQLDSMLSLLSQQLFAQLTSD